MFRPKQLLLLIALVLLIGFGATYLYQRYSALDRLSEEQQVRLTVTEARLDGIERLLNADSLLYAGDYQVAEVAYEQLRGETTELITPARLERRRDFARTQLQRQIELDTLRRFALRMGRLEALPDPTPVLSAPTAAPAPAPSPNSARADSLNFALRKAELRVRNLERRLATRTSDSNYLTFDTRKGNTVYYVGGVRRGKAYGRGVALLSTGSRYEGEWQNNRKHGTGEFFWPDGARYEGEYENDERSGRGTYHFPKGDMFVGEWRDDLRNGEGVFYDKSGKVVARGVWKDDELVERMR